MKSRPGCPCAWIGLAVAAVLTVQAAPAADVSGKWNFVFDTEGGERRSSPTLRVEGRNVTGKWESADVKGTFVDGKLDLSFPFTSTEAGMTGTLKIAGQLTGDNLSGAWEFEGYRGAFKATRADQPPASLHDFLGNWDCELEADQVYPLKLSIKEAEGKVNGKVSGEDKEYEMQSPKLDGGTLSFRVDFGIAILDFKLKAAGDKIEGSWESGGDSGSIHGKKTS